MRRYDPGPSKNQKIRCEVCSHNGARCDFDYVTTHDKTQWVVWTHRCPYCGHNVSKIVRYRNPSIYFDTNDMVRPCPIPGHYPIPEDTPDGRPEHVDSVKYWLHRHINSRTTFRRDAQRQGGVFVSYSHPDRSPLNRLATCRQWFSSI